VTSDGVVGRGVAKKGHGEDCPDDSRMKIRIGGHGSPEKCSQLASKKKY
jgi:hypothetical protein